jgi:uncharacterized protein (DUF58 family)
MRSSACRIRVVCFRLIVMIPQDYLKHIRQVEIRTWRLAEEFLAGAYRSVFKGRGMDFESVRAYAAGDDVRCIDWNVTARMSAPFVKEFKEERELSIIIAADISGSGDLASGEQSKRELIAEAAACLAFSAVSNADKVGLVLFSDKVERYLPPRKGRRQALRIIREALYCQPRSSGTSLKTALNFINHVQTRRAIVFLVSDFLDEHFERSMKVTGRHHDLIPVLVGDRREQTLPDVGWIVVEDAETGEQLQVNTGSKAGRELFAQLSQQRRDELRHLCRRMGTDTIELSTDQPYLEPFQRFMDRRLRQRHR